MVIQMYFIIDVYVLPFKDGDFNCLVLMQMWREFITFNLFIYLFINFESFHCWVRILKNCQINAVEFPVIVINWISLG